MINFYAYHYGFYRVSRGVSIHCIVRMQFKGDNYTYTCVLCENYSKANIKQGHKTIPPLKFPCPALITSVFSGVRFDFEKSITVDQVSQCS